jgi:hypothetical protein
LNILNVLNISFQLTFCKQSLAHQSRVCLITTPGWCDKFVKILGEDNWIFSQTHMACLSCVNGRFCRRSKKRRWITQVIETFINTTVYSIMTVAVVNMKTVREQNTAWSTYNVIYTRAKRSTRWRCLRTGRRTGLQRHMLRSSNWGHCHRQCSSLLLVLCCLISFLNSCLYEHWL